MVPRLSREALREYPPPCNVEDFDGRWPTARQVKEQVYSRPTQSLFDRKRQPRRDGLPLSERNPPFVPDYHDIRPAEWNTVECAASKCGNFPFELQVACIEGQG